MSELKTVRVEVIRVLLVSSSFPLRCERGALLEKHGFAVLHAGSAAEAVVRLDSRAIDVVVSDAVLPDASGLDLLRTLRGDQERRVILLGADLDISDVLAAIHHGVFDYLPDICLPDHLLAALHRARQSVERERGQKAHANLARRLEWSLRERDRELAEARIELARERFRSREMPAMSPVALRSAS